MNRRTLRTPTGRAAMVAFFLSLPVSWAADTEPVPSLAAEAHGDSAAIDERTASFADTSLQAPAAKPSSSGFEATGVAEVERRFNELRREWLDDRAKTVDWWLMGTAIVLAAFGLVVFVGVKEFREIKDEARRSAEEARRSAEVATRHADDARALVEKIRAQVSHVNELTTKAFRDSPAHGSERGPLSEVLEMVPEFGRIAERVAQDPEASAIGQTVAAAIQFEKRGSLEESIERWRAVAIVSEDDDKDLFAAWAWFSVGYLCRKHDRSAPEKAIDAYSKAIGLRPDFAGAYNNRGVLKVALGRFEEAIDDYGEAILLKPEALDRAAEGTRLGRSYAAAHFNRAVVNAHLKRVDRARPDLQAAIALMEGGGDEASRAAEDVLKQLDKETL